MKNDQSLIEQLPVPVEKPALQERLATSYKKIADVMLALRDLELQKKKGN